MIDLDDCEHCYKCSRSFTSNEDVYYSLHRKNGGFNSGAYLCLECITPIVKLRMEIKQGEHKQFRCNKCKCHYYDIDDPSKIHKPCGVYFTHNKTYCDGEIFEQVGLDEYNFTGVN